MTAMPQLVAGFHSLVGLAAVLVALSAFYNPEAFELGTLGNIKTASIIEMSIGASIGAVTFTGSVIAFLKLQGLMSGAPITFKGQHFINLLIGIGIIFLIIYITINQNNHIFWILIASSFLIGLLLIIPIGGADMPVVISMLNSYSGWAAAGIEILKAMIAPIDPPITRAHIMRSKLLNKILTNKNVTIIAIVIPRIPKKFPCLDVSGDEGPLRAKINNTPDIR
jgi:NAD/NADP transhydrogenase beta subunit